MTFFFLKSSVDGPGPIFGKHVRSIFFTLNFCTVSHSSAVNMVSSLGILTSHLDSKHSTQVPGSSVAMVHTEVRLFYPLAHVQSGG